MSSRQQDGDAARVREEAARAAALATAAAGAARRAAAASSRVVGDAVTTAAARSEGLQSAAASRAEAVQDALAPRAAAVQDALAPRAAALQDAFAAALGAAEAAAERTRELVDRLPATEVLEGVVEEAGARFSTAVDRSGEAWDVLRGRKRRRWPWATGAAVLGAAAGVGAALLVRALRHEDPPGAQDPTLVQAVIDKSTDPSAPVPAEIIDEDGEAVQP